MLAPHGQSSLNPAQSAALTALLDPAATIAAVAEQLNLTIEGLLDLVEAPAVRSILTRLAELEALRRRITAAAPISAALRTLTKLLDHPESQPVELRRTATAILRAAQSSERQRRVSVSPSVPATAARCERPAPGRADNPHDDTGPGYAPAVAPAAMSQAPRATTPQPGRCEPGTTTIWRGDAGIPSDPQSTAALPSSLRHTAVSSLLRAAGAVERGTPANKQGRPAGPPLLAQSG